ncbi:MAG: NADH-ubiquinone oxidoreductase-F iron-sulfur binding region domain-containing protein [Desulfobacterales bacterium]
MHVSILKRKPCWDELQEKGPAGSQIALFGSASAGRPRISVCSPSTGYTCDCEGVRRVLEEEISARGLSTALAPMKVGCNGVCPYGPLIGFPGKGLFYRQVSEARAREVVAETLVRGHILFDLLHVDPTKSTSSSILYDTDSGFIATVDDNFCMVQVARYFLEFDKGVSCGKCTPCRVGSAVLREILDRIIEGKSEPEDLQHLDFLCHAMKNASYCDFGRKTSGVVVSVLKHFSSEIEDHVIERRCAAGLCTGLSGESEGQE